MKADSFKNLFLVNKDLQKYVLSKIIFIVVIIRIVSYLFFKKRFSDSEKNKKYCNKKKNIKYKISNKLSISVFKVKASGKRRKKS